jgi:hypothetical protein
MECFPKLTIFLRHKANVNKFKKIEITPCIISDQNRIKLDLKNKRNCRKYSSTWRLNNTLLNDWWVTEEIREQIKTSWTPMQMKRKYQNVWDTEKPC